MEIAAPQAASAATAASPTTRLSWNDKMAKEGGTVSPAPPAAGAAAPQVMRLYAAWEERTPTQGAVPRLCQVQVSRVTLLPPVLRELDGDALVVIAAGMRGGRRTLRSGDIAVVDATGQPAADGLGVDVDFSMQYPHSLKRGGASARKGGCHELVVRLQKHNRYKQRRVPGFKTLCSVSVDMAQVLQRPIDGEVELFAEEKGKERGPLARLRVKVRSFPRLDEDEGDGDHNEHLGRLREAVDILFGSDREGDSGPSSGDELGGEGATAPSSRGGKSPTKPRGGRPRGNVEDADDARKAPKPQWDKLQLPFRGRRGLFRPKRGEQADAGEPNDDHADPTDAIHEELDALRDTASVAGEDDRIAPASEGYRDNESDDDDDDSDDLNDRGARSAETSRGRAAGGGEPFGRWGDYAGQPLTSLYAEADHMTDGSSDGSLAGDDGVVRAMDEGRRAVESKAATRAHPGPVGGQALNRGFSRTSTTSGASEGLPDVRRGEVHMHALGEASPLRASPMAPPALAESARATTAAVVAPFSQQMSAAFSAADESAPVYVLLADGRNACARRLVRDLAGSDCARRVMVASDRADTAAVVRAALQRTAAVGSDAGHDGPSRLVVLVCGTDKFVGAAVTAYVGHVQGNTRAAQEGLARFLVVPVGGKGGGNHLLAARIAALDADYAAAFWDDAWRAAYRVDDEESAASAGRPNAAVDAAARVLRYLDCARFLSEVGIAEVTLNYNPKARSRTKALDKRAAGQAASGLAAPLTSGVAAAAAAQSAPGVLAAANGAPTSPGGPDQAEQPLQETRPFLSSVRVGTWHGRDAVTDGEDAAQSTADIRSSLDSATTALADEAAGGEIVHADGAAQPTADESTGAGGELDTVALQLSLWDYSQAAKAKDAAAGSKPGERQTTVEKKFYTLVVAPQAHAADRAAGSPLPTLAVTADIRESALAKISKPLYKKLGGKTLQPARGSRIAEVNVTKLLCKAADRSAHMKVFVDGAECPGVSFFTVSPVWRTHTNTFPLATAVRELKGE